eukprot:CAMPEP_0119328684 /NCGR_PEP_ID=MMETSP1333-20130426/74007_1 /TAXON_ID=418940 /ORGANISM="Scyphosphaera apsteinii, Strain RCC1455" /LENGTH=41 /DNA_ID= /DNA_START= /DNA_END= /DNA_ORIENTATION=
MCYCRACASLARRSIGAGWPESLPRLAPPLPLAPRPPRGPR